MEVNRLGGILLPDCRRWIQIFFHPDYTVGAGITPAQFRVFSPEVAGFRSLAQQPCSNRRSGITAEMKLISAGSPRPENLGFRV